MLARLIRAPAARASWCSTKAPGWSRWPRQNTSRFSRGPAGWSTTRWRFCDARAKSSRKDWRSAACRLADLAAIGITNQRETTVVWDRKTGEPIANAIVWQDTRVSERRGAIRRRRRTGSFSRPDGLAAKHLLQRAEAQMDAGKCVRAPRTKPQAGDVLFGNIDTFLVWNLTGGSSRRGARHRCNQRKPHATFQSCNRWIGIARIAYVFDIPAAMLPRIVCSSSEIVRRGRDQRNQRRADCRHPRRSASGAGRPGLFPAGEAKNTYGTGCFLLMNTGERNGACNCGLLTTVAYRSADSRPTTRWRAVAITGALVQWLRDNLG